MASGPLAGDGAREKHMNRNNPNKIREIAIDSELQQRPWKKQAPPVRTAIEDRNSSQFLGAAESDDSSDRSFPLSGRSETADGNGLRGYVVFENRVRIALNSCSKIDIRELRRRLTSELDQVRCLVKKLEASAKDYGSGGGGGGGGAHSQFSSNYAAAAENAETGIRVNSAAEKNGEKRMVKKPKGAKGHGGGDRDRMTAMFGQRKDKFSSQLFKSCCNLLDKLMKHKFGWVFNAPVDAKALGLHDYRKIIKRPMDLGTVKTRLTKARYKSALEFAEDVRLTFSNAILYNPKGQDVHSMAGKLLEMFEEKWAVIEANYNLKKRDNNDYDDNDGDDAGGDDGEADLPRPASRKSHALAAPVRSPPLAAPPAMRPLDRSESVTKPLVPESFGRTPVLKKPKAKDLDKRDMTYEEKQKLSTSLQDLPSDKLENVVQIIKKRNLGLCQQEDEIEVDIASVDPETLWELDRFVTNFKKTLSKKRKAELALQSRVAEKNVAHKGSRTDSDSEGSSASGSDSRS